MIKNKTPQNLIAFNFLLIAFLTGIASAFQTPTLSLFLSQEINASPFFVGLFYSANAIIGIILSHILAKYSDHDLLLPYRCCRLPAIRL